LGWSPVSTADQVASDCFKVAQLTIERQQEELMRRTEFLGTTPELANTALADGAKQAADLEILALFATFERFVIEHLQSTNRLLANGYPERYSHALAEKFVNDVEYHVLLKRKPPRQSLNSRKRETAMSKLTVADALRLAINVLRDSAESRERLPAGSVAKTR
jgi:hypothetical protein